MLFPVVALAQEPQIPPPQLPSVIDQNGVRLNTGKIGLGHSYGKVGAGQGGLGLSASKWIGGQDPDDGWRENIDNTIEADGTLLIVSVGGSYDAFGWNISTDTLTASVGSVATLQFIDGGSFGRKFVYTSPDGSVFTFPTDVTAYELENLHPDNGRQLLASLSEVIHPDGEIDTYSLYAASPARPQIITNNLGYMQRGFDGWAPINLGSIFCAATITSCTEFSAAQWPGYANPAPSFQVNGEHLQEFHAASGFGQDEYWSEPRGSHVLSESPRFS